MVREKKRVYPTVLHYICICLDGLKETVRIFSQDIRSLTWIQAYFPQCNFLVTSLGNVLIHTCDWFTLRLSSI